MSEEEKEEYKEKKRRKTCRKKKSDSSLFSATLKLRCVGFRGMGWQKWNIT